MSKVTYYGIFQRGKLVQASMRFIGAKKPVKVPLLFLSARFAERVARERCGILKKPNRVKTVVL
jgi:hypothetical protein